MSETKKTKSGRRGKKEKETLLYRLAEEPGSEKYVDEIGISASESITNLPVSPEITSYFCKQLFEIFNEINESSARLLKILRFPMIPPSTSRSSPQYPPPLSSSPQTHAMHGEFYGIRKLTQEGRGGRSIYENNDVGDDEDDGDDSSSNDSIKAVNGSPMEIVSSVEDDLDSV